VIGKEAIFACFKVIDMSATTGWVLIRAKRFSYDMQASFEPDVSPNTRVVLILLTGFSASRTEAIKFVSSQRQREYDFLASGSVRFRHLLKFFGTISRTVKLNF
jgi:hypothetical protein